MERLPEHLEEPVVPEPQSEEKQGTERTSGIVRVANASKERQDEVLGDIKTEVFDKQELGKKEREKTPEEIKIIEEVLAKMPDFVEKYGGKPVPVRPEHIHIMNPSDLPEVGGQNLKGTIGIYSTSSQKIAISPSITENKLGFAGAVSHEVIHFNAFQSITRREHSFFQEPSVFATRSSGFSVSVEAGKKGIPYSPLGKKAKTMAYFYFINEAMTEELTKRFDEECFGSIPLLAPDIENREKFRAGIVSEAKAEDIRVVNPVKGILRGFVPKGLPYYYAPQRKKLWKIIGEIKKKNSRKFDSDEDVFNVFARAYFTGKKLEAARLIEKTFGKGSFRKLGKKTRAK